jgi:hypothetical protein
MNDKIIICPVCKELVECYSLAAKYALEHAIENLGQKEATGRNDGAFVERRQRWASIPIERLKALTKPLLLKLLDGAQAIVPYFRNAPWCVMASTLSAWIGCEKAGVKCNITERASTRRIENEFKKKGKLSKSCINGGIAMLHDAKGNTEHTYLAVHQVGDKIHGVDGNISNKQRTTSFHLASRSTFGPVEG